MLLAWGTHGHTRLSLGEEQSSLQHHCQKSQDTSTYQIYNVLAPHNHSDDSATTTTDLQLTCRIHSSDARGSCTHFNLCNHVVPTCAMCAHTARKTAPGMCGKCNKQHAGRDRVVGNSWLKQTGTQEVHHFDCDQLGNRQHTAWVDRMCAQPSCWSSPPLQQSLWMQLHAAGRFAFAACHAVCKHVANCDSATCICLFSHACNPQTCLVYLNALEQMHVGFCR